jgi:hypothetical protein
LPSSRGENTNIFQNIKLLFLPLDSEFAKNNFEIPENLCDEPKKVEILIETKKQMEKLLISEK